MAHARRTGVPRIALVLAPLLALHGCTCVGLDPSGGDGCGIEWPDGGWSYDAGNSGCGYGMEGGASCLQMGGTCVSSIASCPQVVVGYCASGVCCGAAPDAEPDAAAEAGADATFGDGGADAGQDATVEDGPAAQDGPSDGEGGTDS
jgi:hypothetical protein